MRKRGIDQFPEFPPKKLFNNTDREFVEKRIKKLNVYFQSIFEVFPDKVLYTNALIDVCQPLRLNIAVIGDKQTGKTELIRKSV